MRDRIFLSITAGPSPRDAVPVVATEDPRVIDAALLAVCRRLGRKPDDDRGPEPKVRRERA